MQPKVSILVPTYNVEPYLKQCMDSIVGQTLKEIEIICINDGSTDNSLSILRSYAEKDNRIIIVDKENGGYGVAMNIATDIAKGEYIGIVEPDDFVEVRMFEDLYNKAKENDLDFVKADFYRFAKDDVSGDINYTLNRLSKTPEDYNVIFDPSSTTYALKFVMNTWSGIYKKTFIEENNIRYNETPGASFQDNGFWFQTFVYAKKAMILDTPYYLNRRDNPNSSVKDVNKVYAMNVEYDYIKKILCQNPEKWEFFKGMYWYKKYHNYMITLKRISKEFKKDYVFRISEEFKFAYQKNEFDESSFSSFAWRKVCLLMNDPTSFFLIEVASDEKTRNEIYSLRKENAKMQKKLNKLNKKLKKKEKELNNIKRSMSFRLGRLILFIPRTVKNAICRKG